MQVEELLAKMPEKFNADAAEGLDAVFQFDVEDGDNFHLAVKDNAMEITKGDHPEPEVKLMMSSETFVGMMTGEKDGMAAFMAGELKADGNIMLATKLNQLFPN